MSRKVDFIVKTGRRLWPREIMMYANEYKQGLQYEFVGYDVVADQVDNWTHIAPIIFVSPAGSDTKLGWAIWEEALEPYGTLTNAQSIVKIQGNSFVTIHAKGAKGSKERRRKVVMVHTGFKSIIYANPTLTIFDSSKSCCKVQVRSQTGSSGMEFNIKPGLLYHLSCVCTKDNFKYNRDMELCIY